MSLRRSTRVASTKAIENDKAQAPNNIAKYEKIAKPTPAPKKRKAKAITTSSPSQATQDEPSSKILPAPDLPFAVPVLPVTPVRKRRKAASESPVKPPPFTPTPSGVGLITSSVGPGDHLLDNLGSSKPRPAEPHATNAPLSTPGGSRVVAYQSSPVQGSQEEVPSSQQSPAKKRKAKEVVPPDVGAIPAASTDIDHLLEEAEAFLISVDPKFKVLVEKHHCKVFNPEGLREVVDPFTALSSGIIGQQVCGQPYFIR